MVRAPLACPSGYYCPLNSVDITECPAGKSCASPAASMVDCTLGTYSIGRQTTCITCPNGFYCPAVDKAPILCASGYYTPAAGATSCTQCPAGKYCPGSLSTHLKTTPPGYYSFAGMTYYIQCMAGYFCPDTIGTMTKCAEGFYSAPATSTSCTQCPAGSACPTTSEADKYACPTGTYSLIGATYCIICPAGYSCTSTSTSVCASGSFSQPGAMTCTDCPAGFYCPYNNAPHVLPCPPGTYSNVKATVCTVCPAGTACSTKTAAVACSGTTSYAIGGAHVCSPCPGGMSCAGGVGTPCSAGYYSPAGVDLCTVCPAGSYCPTATANPILCPPGTFTSATTQVICTICAQGTYSIEGANICTDCPAGYHCPATYITPRKCPPGTYSAIKSTACTPCTPGKYCAAGVTDTGTFDCPAGYYCNYISNMGFGGIGMLPCPPGTFRTAVGGTTVGSCSTCTAGSYCPAGSAALTPCPKGHYCPAGTMFLNQYPCPPATFNTATGATSAAACIACTATHYCPAGSPSELLCPPGYYCPASTGYLTNNNLMPAGSYTGLTPLATGSNACPKGHYCPVGCVFAVPCPPGTFNAATGATSRAGCSKCAAGKVCEKYGNIADSAVDCPLGYYCPLGTEYPREYPCPPGTYGATVALPSEVSCTQCPAGMACDGGTNANTNPQKRCQPGHYCPAGSASPKQMPCPAGTYSTSYQNSAPASCSIICDAGYYCLAGSDRVTGECQEGYYCPAGSKLPNAVPCPAGKYSTLRKLYDPSQCTTCPAGSYCPPGLTAPIVCPGGTYNAVAGKGLLTDCTTCEAGYYCPRGAANHLECGLGKYSMAGSKLCLDCLAGHYCNSATTSDSAMTFPNVCGGGYYCPKGTGAYPSTAVTCPAGYSCGPGVDRPTKCAPGLISADQATTCISATEGTYTTLGRGTPTGDCKAGYICPTGSWSSIATPCPAGSYRGTPGGKVPADCISCPDGYYCQEATAIPVLCPQGYYCPLNSPLPTKCEIGKYGASFGLFASTQCTKCPAGTYCSLPGLPAPEGLCDAGYFCILGAKISTPTDGTTGNICPAGGYCETGSRVAQSCPPGRYNPSAGGRDLEACIQCPPGKYCSGEAKDVATGDCAAGYYCPTGSYMNNMQPANPGYFTLAAQATQTECPEGYYNPYYAQSVCLKCPPGFLCQGTANAGTFINCPMGNFCPEGSVLATTCSKGTYNPNYNGKSLADCWPCPPGKYCAIVGLDAPGDGTASSSDCDAGYFCKTLSDTKAPDAGDVSGNFGPCPTGFYCPSGISSPIPCPPGTYSDETKISSLSQCKPCTKGYYCSAGGLSAVEGQCGAGYFCPTSTKVPKPAASICQVGYYCPTGSSDAIVCAPGTYQDEIGQSSCKTCPAGFYCPSGTSALTGLDCPEGYYCPSGTQQQYQNPCPIGTYNPYKNANVLAQCIACDPGKYCTGTGQSAIAGACTQGYYCKLGSPIATPPSTATGAPADHGNVCPLGSYCPTGSAIPIKCPGGKYCGTTKLYDNQGDCAAGYYCRLGSTSKTPTNLAAQGGEKCPTGHYCPAGSDSPTPCPPGTFSSNVGNGARTDCTTCTSGKYCKDAGATVETGTCTAGYYCQVAVAATVGYTTPNPAGQLCPIGYYCPAGAIKTTQCTTGFQDLQGQSSCKACPAGYYCTSTAKFLCRPGLENLSYYCPADVMDKVNCPAGTYNMVDGTTSSGDCMKCPPGFYCPVDAAKAKIISCKEGYYCKNTGASVETGDGKCPVGYYCPLGTQNPVPCPAGKFCSIEGLTDAVLTVPITYDCNAGYICYGKSSSATPSDAVTGDYCPAGSYCPAGTKAPIACPIGYYRTAMKGESVADCIQCTAGKSCNSRGLAIPTVICPAGYYCVLGTSTERQTPCPIGAYCPSGSSAYTVCADKTYQNKPASTECIDCPERFYCKNSNDITKSTKPVECPAGKYCGERTAVPTDCPIATFSARPGLATSSECDSCTPGYYCATIGLTAPTAKCSAGYYCSGGSKTSQPNDATGSICTKGHYCEEGSTAPTPCPPGTYNDYTGKVDATACLSCIPGYFCPLRGATSMNLKFGASEFKCTAGYYCTGKAVIPNPTDGITGNLCAAGTYCPAGSAAETDCEKGYYNPDPGQSACIACPAGKYCPTTKMTVPTPCPAGAYCLAGAYKITACPAGTYSPFTDLESSDECIECDPGKYCLGGKNAVDGICDAGYVCPKKSSAASSGSIYSLAANSAGLCPMGYYCLAGSSAPIPCPIGTYNDGVGTAACKLCPAGKYCDELAQTSASKSCAAGHLCISGAKHARPLDQATEGGRLCTAGFYCSAGATSEKPCAAGYFEPRTGSSACQLCPAGYYCEGLSSGTTTPTNCPVKYYCPAGSSTYTQCPDGTFGQTGSDKLESDSQCLPCPSGKYCKLGAVTADCNAGYYCDAGAAKPSDTTKLCPSGHYCLVGAKLPTRCPSGKFNLDVGATDLTFCKDCTTGYYCIAGSSVPLKCPMGHYCPPPASKPLACPIGTYQPDTLQTSPLVCKFCPEGSYCYEEAVYDPTMYPCPVGKYCVVANSTNYKPYDCPYGKYRNTTGAQSEDDCLACPGGYVCENGTIHPKPCHGGFFCTGTSNETTCPAGSYCPPITKTPIICPGAYYCPLGAEIYIKCQNGYYCPEGSSSPTACPSGYTGSYNLNNVNVSMGCTECTPGYYSVSTTSTLECIVCTPGYVCIGGTNVATPTDTERDGGEECPVGYYCPAGTYKPISCPQGTYNNLKLRSSLADCLACQAGSFNPYFAASSCMSCGNSSIATADALTCECKGKYRAYQVKSGKCLCQPQYEPVDGSSTDDSKIDCQPIIFDRCSSSQIRNPEGKCVDKDYCPECPNGKGTRSSGIGVCECVKVAVLSDVCNDTCRSQVLTLSISYTGAISIVDPMNSNANVSISMSDLPKVYGSMSCPTTNCKVASMSLSNSLGFSANYRPTTSVVSAYTKSSTGTRLLTERRLLGTALDQGITNPIVCLSLGDTMMFELTTSKDYPVYDKDNLLNSNPDFDYSAFVLLAEKLQTGASISDFGFTFTQAGRYVFKNNNNGDQITIIGVMDTNEKCSDSSRYIQSISTSSLLKLGVTQNEDIILSPDWGLIFGLISAILFGTPLLIGFIRYFTQSSWLKSKATEINYRTVNQKADYDEFTSKGKEWKRDLFKGPEGDHLQAPQANGSLNVLVDEDNPLIARPNDRERQIIEMRKKENIEGVHEIPTDIFRDLYKELQYHAKFVKDEFARKAGLDSDNIRKVFAEIDRLKLLMQEKLQNIAKSYGRGIRLIFNEKTEGDGELFVEHDKQEDEDEEKKKEENKSVVSESDEEKQVEKVEFKPEVLQELDQRDQDKVDEMAEMLRNEHAVIEKQLDDDEKQRREQFQQEISANSKLSPDEKKALLADFDKSNAKLQKLLMVEEQAGEDKLQQMLDQRRKRRLQMQDEVTKLQDKKGEIEGDFAKRLQEVEAQKQAINAGIDQEIEKEKNEEVSKLEQKKKQELQDVRQKFQKKMKKDMSEGKRSNQLEKFSQKMKALEDELEDARKKDQEEMLMKLDMKRQNRRAEREQELKKKERELKEEQAKEVKSINAKLTVLNENLQNEQMDEMLKKAQEEAEKDDVGETAQNPAASEEMVKENRAKESVLQQETDAKLDEERKALIKEEQVEINSLEQERTAAAKQVQAMINKVRDKKAELTAQVAKATAPADKKKLLEEYQQYKTDVEQQVQTELTKQNAAFDDKIAERKRRRAAKEAESRAVQEKDLEELKKNNRKEEAGLKRRQDEQRLQRQIEKMKMMLTQDEVPFAVERLLDDKHMDEFAQMLRRQLQEKAQILKSNMEKLLKLKAEALQRAKEGIENQAAQAKKLCDKGIMKKEEYLAKVEEFKELKEKALKDVEFEYAQKQNELEEQKLMAIEKANSEELVEMLKTQSGEKQMYMQAFVSDEFLKKVLAGDKTTMDKELADYEGEVVNSYNKRNKEIEEKRRKIEEILMKDNAKIHELESQAQKMLEDQEVRDKKREEKQKKAIQEKLASKEEELSRQKGITEEEKRQLLEEHQKELATLTDSMEKERARQRENITSRIQEKLKQKEFLKKQRDEQITIIQKEEDKLLDAKVKEIQKEKGIETEEEKGNLVQLNKKYEHVKMVYEKMKPIAGVELEPEKEQENVLKGILDSKKKTAKEPSKIDLSFELLFDRLRKLESSVTTITGLQFEQIFAGFLDLNNKLENITSGNVQKLPPGKLEEAKPDEGAEGEKEEPKKQEPAPETKQPEDQ